VKQETLLLLDELVELELLGQIRLLRIFSTASNGYSAPSWETGRAEIRATIAADKIMTNFITDYFLGFTNGSTTFVFVNTISF
jgi:hypothetical protein